jgi:hypothetical protein
MAELHFPMRDRATKPLRDRLKQRGLKLVETRRYAVVRGDDGEVVCSGTFDDIFKWHARQIREGEL